jgi:uncharacterized protein
MSEFAIELGTLPPGASRVHLEAPARAIDLPDVDWSGDAVADLDVDRNGDRLAIRGSLRATARLECVRCLRAFEQPLTAAFEVFADRAGSGRRIEEEALERDDYMKFHDGRRLELGEEAREVLLLELPIAPRCREDCRGLCPECGADLNEGPCPHTGRGESDG